MAATTGATATNFPGRETVKAAERTSGTFEMFTELSEYRELLRQMIKRDLLIRYKQTVMGFAWAIFMPLVNTVVFSVIFTRVAPVNTPVPYPLFAFCGLLFWNYLASSARFSVMSLTNNENLVTKVYFPREIFPFSAVIVSLIDCAVASFVLVAMMVYYGIHASWALAALPIVIFNHVAFTAGIALLLAMANLFYRDVKFLFEIVVTMWMFATPVVYPVERVTGVIGLLIRLNPMTSIIESYRSVLLYQRVPDPQTLAVSMAISTIVLLVGWRTFHSAEYAFAENI